MFKIEEMKKMFDVKTLESNMQAVQKAVLDQAEKNFKTFSTMTEAGFEQWTKAYVAVNAEVSKGFKGFFSKVSE
jgi:hypothetical protein